MNPLVRYKLLLLGANYLTTPKKDTSLLNVAGAATGGIAGGLIGGGMNTDVGNALSLLSGVAAAIPGPWGAIASAGLAVAGGLTNRMFGSKMNQENIAKVEANINSLNNFLSNASDFDTLAENWANADVGMTFNNSFIGKDGWFSHKARNKANALRDQISRGNEWVLASLFNNAENVSAILALNLLSNYAAYGGHLLSKGGKIHINPKNRGKFNALKERTGKTTEELTHSKNPLTRKRAIFALNAKKWHHAFGGNLFEDGGYTWKDGLVDATSFLPGVGTVMDGYLLLKDPSWENAGYFGLSLAAEIPFLKWLRGARIAKNAAKATSEVADAVDAYTKAAKRAAKMEAKGTLNPISVLVAKNARGTAYGDMNIAIAKERRALHEVDKQQALENITKWPLVVSDGLANEYLIILDRKDYIKAFGGELGTNGADFSNGIIEINSGETHELNPNEGVLMGIDQEGIPNLVEEGEVVFGDYVFSNRIKVPKDVRKRHRLTDGVTFANAAKELAKESEERPNDPISQNGLEYLMGDLMKEQELMRNNKTKNKPTSNKYPLGGSLANLRYIPALGSLIGTTTDLLGITNNPDYGPSSMVLETGRNLKTPSVRFSPIGNYLTYTPFDRDYYINKLNSLAGATRRTIMNTSGGNRAAALSGLLSTDNNYLNQLGNLARLAEEYNLAQRQLVENFNRATNLYNSEGALKAAVANAENRLKTNNLIMESIMTGAKMRQAAKDASDLAKSTNLSNLFDNLGNIGWEEYLRNAIESNPALLGYYRDRSGSTRYKGKGGYLTIKRRRK